MQPESKAKIVFSLVFVIKAFVKICINIQMNAYNVHSDRVKSLLNTDLDFKILFVLNIWQLVLAGDIQFLLPDRWA